MQARELCCGRCTATLSTDHMIVLPKYSVNFVAKGMKRRRSRELPESGFRASWNGAAKIIYGNRPVSMARWFMGGSLRERYIRNQETAKCAIARALYLSAGFGDFGRLL